MNSSMAFELLQRGGCFLKRMEKWEMVVVVVVGVVGQT